MDAGSSYSPFTHNHLSPLATRFVDLDENSYLFIDHERHHDLLRDGHHTLAADLKQAGRATFLSYARWFEANYHEPLVDVFRLCVSNPLEIKEDVEKLIRIATRKYVDQIELDFSDRDLHESFPEGYVACYTLPGEVYQLHVTLKSLKLCGCRIECDRFGSLNRLRRLVLERVDLGSEPLDMLIEQAPSLMELRLKKVSWMAGFKIIDVKGKLKLLAIEECLPIILELKIVAPGLKHFRYSGFATKLILENFVAIEEATLDFNQHFEFEADGDHLSQALVSLGNAKALTLCSYLTQVITTGKEKNQLPSTMHMITKLELKRTKLDAEEIEGFIFLLRSFPNLESLIIEATPRSGVLTKRPIAQEMDYNKPLVDPQGFWEAETLLPIECIEHCLKVVKIKSFSSTDRNVVKFLKFLLKRSAILQELTVSSATGDTLEWETLMTCASIAQELMHMEKASQNVKIDFC